MATWQPQRHTGTATRTPTEMSTWPGSGGLAGLKGQLPKPPGHSLEATPARPEGTSFSQWVQSGTHSDPRWDTLGDNPTAQEKATRVNVNSQQRS